MRRDRMDPQWFDVINAEDRTAQKKLIAIKKIGRTSFYLQSPQTCFLDIRIQMRCASTKIEASKLGSLSQFFYHGIYMRC